MQFNLRLVTGISDKTDDPEEFIGAIVISHLQELQEAKLRKIPFLQVMGSVFGTEAWDRVSYNNKAIGSLAAQHFFKLGKKRVAVMAQPADLLLERKDAYIHACENLRLVLIETPLDIQSALKFSTDPQNQIEAVFTCDDNLLLQLCTVLHFQNLVPMKDLTVLGCNAMTSILDQIKPTPHSINLHGESIARIALNQLLLRRQYPDLPITHIQLCPSLALPQAI